MNRMEYEMLEDIETEKERVICAEDLGSNMRDRTLMYGYTCARDTFHVYLKNGEIHIVIYDDDYSNRVKKPKNMREVKAESNYDFIPDKRLYPECCDYDFCRLLKLKGIHLPFTCWSENNEPKDFYGFTL